MPHFWRRKRGVQNKCALGVYLVNQIGFDIKRLTAALDRSPRRPSTRAVLRIRRDFSATPAQNYIHLLFKSLALFSPLETSFYFRSCLCATYIYSSLDRGLCACAFDCAVRHVPKKTFHLLSDILRTNAPFNFNHVISTKLLSHLKTIFEQI